MRYADYDNVEGKQGGPYHTEETVLEREKRSAATEEREPNYQQVLDDLYSGNLPTHDSGDPLRISHDQIVYDHPNSQGKQTAKELAVADTYPEKDETELLFGNTGNQDVDTTGTFPDEVNPDPEDRTVDREKFELERPKGFDEPQDIEIGFTAPTNEAPGNDVHTILPDVSRGETPDSHDETIVPDEHDETVTPEPATENKPVFDFPED